MTLGCLSACWTPLLATSSVFSGNLKWFGRLEALWISLQVKSSAKSEQRCYKRQSWPPWWVPFNGQLVRLLLDCFFSISKGTLVLTKLGYLIDNPWNNALDRAKAAGSVLADVLIQRHLGVRPMTLIGFSLGARVIFYALVELAKQKAYGIVQDVFILGTTVTASSKTWCETRSVVSGRYVNAFARNDWVLNYLFRATSGGVGTVAG